MTTQVCVSRSAFINVVKDIVERANTWYSTEIIVNSISNSEIKYEVKAQSKGHNIS